MIKNLKLEIVFLLIIIVFLFSGPDQKIQLYFNSFDQGFSKVFGNPHIDFLGDKKHFLKKFFVNITSLGNSVWYFAVIALGILLLRGLERKKLKTKLFLNRLKHFFYFAFASLFLTGLITQILKHFFGRARPNHATSSDLPSGFNFFSTESSFHSFPSGHTSTIFLIAFVLSLLIPKLKFSFYIFAFIVAFSRIVVGAHYLSDIFAGIVVASASFKLTLFVFNKKLPSLKPSLVLKLKRTSPEFIFLNLLLISVLLTVGPSLDIFFSSLFYKGNGQFLFQSYYSFVLLVREIMLPAVLIYVALLPILSRFLKINMIFFNYIFSKKDLFFIWGSILLNTIIVHLFKNLWGRARPGDITQLGGEGVFSSWYQISDACTTNCSFVSGDSAAGFSIIILYFVTKKLKYIYLSVLFGFLLGFVRISEGAHFLSDVVFSGMIVMLFTFFLKKYLKQKYDY